MTARKNKGTLLLFIQDQKSYSQNVFQSFELDNWKRTRYYKMTIKHHILLTMVTIRIHQYGPRGISSCQNNKDDWFEYEGNPITKLFDTLALNNNGGYNEGQQQS